MMRVFLVALLLLVAAPARSATIVINNLNAPGEGFNDTTPVPPVGGNSGTTIGEQRLIVFEEAAAIWGALLESDVTIVVDATFEDQFCDATSATLGSAGPIRVFRNFSGAEFNDTWYHVALANKLAATDLTVGEGDIRARFNARLNGDPSCLGGTGWYYGLDGNEGSAIELLPVVLHEIGHGLGFSSFVDGSTGELFQGLIDVYSRFLFDEDAELAWSEMNDFQRRVSAITPQEVVWTGSAVSFAAPLVLNEQPALEITAPPAIAELVTEIGTAAFGPSIDAQTVSGPVIEINDGTAPQSDGCTPAQNAGTLNGAIALITRGSCNFTTKTLNAQDAGAIGVILVNSVAGDPAPQMAGTDPSITIPTLSVTFELGTAIQDQLDAGEAVQATIGTIEGRYAGASETTDRVLVYTPNPLQQGSSVSHWDVSASPSLLMEPAITGGLSRDVDLTLEAFEDQGWLLPRVTSTDDTPSVVATRLRGNAPNPFNPKTTIAFDLARDGTVTLDIYDAAGRRVRTLVDGRRTAGPYRVDWNGRDEAGLAVASGVYRARLRADGVDQSRAMVLIK